MGARTDVAWTIDPLIEFVGMGLACFRGPWRLKATYQPSKGRERMAPGAIQLQARKSLRLFGPYWLLESIEFQANHH